MLAFIEIGADIKDFLGTVNKRDNAEKRSIKDTKSDKSDKFLDKL